MAAAPVWALLIPTPIPVTDVGIRINYFVTVPTGCTAVLSPLSWLTLLLDREGQAQVLSRTAADTAGVSDTAARSPFVGSRAAVDAVPASDSPTVTDAAVRTATDTAGASGRAVLLSTGARTSADAAAAADSTTGRTVVARGVFDDATACDAPTRTGAAGRCSTVTAAADDEATRTVSTSRVSADLSAADDIPTQGVTLRRAAADTTAVAATVGIHRILVRAVSDLASASDVAKARRRRRFPPGPGRATASTGPGRTTSTSAAGRSIPARSTV